MITGYTFCAGCGIDVIGETLCVYCEENRVLYGMHDVADLTPNELDTLASLSECTHPDTEGE